MSKIQVVTFGTVGNNVADDTSAFNKAIVDSNVGGNRRSVNVDVPLVRYRFNGALNTSGNVVVRGDLSNQNGVPGVGMFFYATPGGAGGQWDFSAAEAFPRLVNLYIAHNAAAAVANGVGLKFNAASDSDLRHLYVSNFDTGILFAGPTIYGEWSNIICIDNKTYGLHVGAGGLLNGMALNGGKFSRTVGGTGIYLENVGANFSLRNIFREANAVGINAQLFMTISDEGGYFEQQTSYDIITLNIYPFSSGLYSLKCAYFDHYAPSTLALPRMRATLTKVYAESNKFFNRGSATPFAPTNPPFSFDRSQQCTPSIFINNSYETEFITDSTKDAGHFIVDNKHPLFLPSFGSPVGFMARAGTVFYNTDPATMNAIFGWKVSASGWCGTPAAIAPTATTTATSNLVNLSTNSAWYVGEGDEISIAGVTFGASNAASTMVLFSKPGPVLYIMDVANNTVAGAAVTYPQATLQVIPGPGVVAGQGAAGFSGTNIACASGANVLLIEITIPQHKKMVIDLTTLMSEETASAIGTVKKILIFVSNNAGTIAGVVSEINTTNGGVGYAHTVSIVDGGSNRARLIISQTTGNPLICAWSATVSNLIALPNKTG